MARGRMISKSLSTSEKFGALATTAGELAEFCQLLYPLLVIHTDDFGRLQGDPITVKLLCFPGSPRSIPEFETALRQLHDVKLIVWYAVNAKRYVQIRRFEEHQQGLHKRTHSKYPSAPDESYDSDETYDSHDSDESHDLPVPYVPPEIPGQENRREQKGREQKYPPTPRLLDANRGIRLSRKELEEAERIRNIRFGCQHEPRCATAKACVRLIALERRAS